MSWENFSAENGYLKNLVWQLVIFLEQIFVNLFKPIINFESTFETSALYTSGWHFHREQALKLFSYLNLKQHLFP